MHRVKMEHWSLLDYLPSLCSRQGEGGGPVSVDAIRCCYGDIAETSSPRPYRWGATEREVSESWGAKLQNAKN